MSDYKAAVRFKGCRILKHLKGKNIKMDMEILFKAKCKNWKQLPKEECWVEGYYCKRKSGHYTTTGFVEEYKD